jgi:hypothetical protein
VGDLPYAPTQYFDDLFIALSYLFVCWFSIWLGLITLSNNKKNYKIVGISISSIVIIGLLVLIFNYINNSSIINVRVNGGEHSFSILSFLFSDNAYLLLIATLLNISLNNNNDIKNINSNLKIFSIIYILFIYLFFISGSKAAPLIVSFLMILLPASFLITTNSEQIIFIKKRFVMAFILISPILFYLAHYKRLQYASGVEISFADLIKHFFNINLIDIFYSFEPIFYRFSWGGLDQYIIIFKSFILEDYDDDNIKSLITYLIKNFINLVLPGTPYPNSYFPTSQIFFKIINQLPLYSIYDKTAIITKANNQPFTIFGFFVIIFGIFAPVFLYIFSLLFSFAMNSFSNIFIKLILFYTFLNMLPMFGFEVILANSIQILISIYFIGLLLKTFSLKINFK